MSLPPHAQFNVDSPPPTAAAPLATPLVVSGWFFDAAGRPATSIVAEWAGAEHACVAVERRDVLAHFKDLVFSSVRTGFRVTLTTPGRHRLRVLARAADGTETVLAASEYELMAPPAAAPTPPPDGDELVPPVLPSPQLTGRPQVIVSVLFYQREDLVFRCIETLLPQLHVAAATADVSLACVLNYPASPDFVARVRGFLAEQSSAYPAARVLVDLPGYNLGFGAGHNRVFRAHAPDLFIALNSDVRIDQPDWIRAVVDEFRGSPVAIAGLAETAARLREDGCGLEAPNPAEEGFDFVDGSMLAVNGATARSLGLFSEAFPYFYFEDADLCLRYRQAQLHFKLLDLPYHHDRYSSTGLLPRPLVAGVLDHNRARFFELWAPFLEHRRLGRRILVRLDAAHTVLQCATLPALFGLLHEHPACLIDIVGIHPDLAGLFRHPRFRLVAEASAASTYFRLHELLKEPASTQPLIDAVAAAFGTEPHLEAARTHLFGLAAAGVAATVVVVPRRETWQHGYVPPAGAWSGIIAGLRARGRVTVLTELPEPDWPEEWRELARPLSSREGGAVLPALLAAPLIVSSDHWVLQLGQILGRRCFGWFGATLPARRVRAWNSSGAYHDGDLACLGCAHTMGSRGENYCLRGDEACLRPAATEAFLEQLADFVDIASPRPWLQAAFRSSQFCGRNRPSPSLDLSRWRRSLIDRVLVLTPVKPGLPAATMARCRLLAERAVAGLPGSRIVIESGAAAPPRGAHPFRQEALAAIRQDLIDRHLADARWVFWLDADIVDIAEDLVLELARRSGGGIAAPFVIMDGDPRSAPTNSHGFGPGRFFDVAGFVEAGAWARFTKPHFNQPGPTVDLESVGSCYLVDAEIYRRGARHVADDRSRAFVASGRPWPEDAVERGQQGQPLAFTEHYSVCAFARAHGRPVRAHADLVALHEQVG